MVLVGVGVRVGSEVAVLVGRGVAETFGVTIGSLVGGIISAAAESAWDEILGPHALAPKMSSKPRRISLILFTNWASLLSIVL